MSSNAAIVDLPPAAPTLPSHRFSRLTLLALFAVLAVAALLRIVNFPHRYELRDVDETGYMSSGLVIFEGMTPGYRASPAGPECWITWIYAAMHSARDMVHTPAIAAAPLKVRPFLAVDATLFSIYEDMSGLHRFLLIFHFAISLAGVYAAFRLGAYRGGMWAGIILGGLVALLPLFVEYAAMTRSYSDAWSFAFLALYSAAARRGVRRWLQTGLLMGLAVASRIDMLAILPIVFWQLWESRKSRANWILFFQVSLTACLTTLVLAPWLYTSLIGVLRMIVTTRVTGQQTVPYPRRETFVDLFWGQGLGIAILFAIAMLPLIPKALRVRHGLLTVYALALVCSMFTGTYQPFRYHALAIIAILTLVGFTAATAIQLRPRLAPVLAAAILILPAIQAVRTVMIQRAIWAPDDATAWIEQHIAPGTRVYDATAMDLRTPLPTEQSADAIWDQLTDDQSWRRKFGRGLSRFGLSQDYVPRALSEDNLALDRSNWRRFFILGGEPQSTRPRYDLQIYGLSPTFGVVNLPDDFARNGGVVIWRGEKPPSELGTPVVKWINAANLGTYIFCSKDVTIK